MEETGQKQYTYLVEVVYDNVVVENNGEADMHKFIELDTQVFSFTDTNKSVARQNAAKFYDEVVRYGIKRSGGSIIKSVVPPSAIKMVGLVDLEKWQEEQEAFKSKAVASLVPSDMVAAAESTLIEDVVDAD